MAPLSNPTSVAPAGSVKSHAKEHLLPLPRYTFRGLSPGLNVYVTKELPLLLFGSNNATL